MTRQSRPRCSHYTPPLPPGKRTYPYRAGRCLHTEQESWYMAITNKKGVCFSRNWVASGWNTGSGREDRTMDWREGGLSQARLEAPVGYQVMIDYIKAQVGEGPEYRNDLVRVVLSERGCYYQFRDLPEEFSGAVGSGFRHEFIGTQRGLDLLQAVHEIALGPETASTNEVSLMVIYGWDGLFRREDAFIYHWSRDAAEEEGPDVIGLYRPHVLPLFFKLKADSDLVEPLLGARRGVLFFVSNLTDQHLLVRIPHVGAGVTDLSEVPGSRMVH